MAPRRQLERLAAPFAHPPSGRAISGYVGVGKLSFNQLNRNTGHRITYAKVDADGEEVVNEEIVKGYKVDTDTFIEVTKEELENVALESTRTMEIDEFVDRSEIDPRYLIRPYYLIPTARSATTPSPSSAKPSAR
jgi:Ku protein